MTEGDVVEQPGGTSTVGSDRQRQRGASRKSSNLLNAPFFWPGLIRADVPLGAGRTRVRTFVLF
jgi:hypothetical protein